MWQNNVTKLDETIQVKGCLGRLMPKKMKKIAKVKGYINKSSPRRLAAGISPKRTAAVAAVTPTRRAAVMRSAWNLQEDIQKEELKISDLDDEDKENRNPAAATGSQKGSTADLMQKKASMNCLMPSKLQAVNFSPMAKTSKQSKLKGGYFYLLSFTIAPIINFLAPFKYFTFLALACV